MIPSSSESIRRGPKIILVGGLVKLTHVEAYHFWLNLAATFSQPRARCIKPCSFAGRFRFATLQQLYVSYLEKHSDATEVKGDDFLLFQKSDCL